MCRLCEYLPSFVQGRIETVMPGRFGDHYRAEIRAVAVDRETCILQLENLGRTVPLNPYHGNATMPGFRLRCDDVLSFTADVKGTTLRVVTSEQTLHIFYHKSLL